MKVEEISLENQIFNLSKELEKKDKHKKSERYYVNKALSTIFKGKEQVAGRGSYNSPTEFPLGFPYTLGINDE